MIFYKKISLSYTNGIPYTATVSLDVQYPLFAKIINALQQQKVFSCYSYIGHNASLELELSVYAMNAFLTWLSVNEEEDIENLQMEIDNQNSMEAQGKVCVTLSQGKMCVTLFEQLQAGQKLQVLS